MNQSTKLNSTPTKEYQDGANPLHLSHDVAKQNNGTKDGEELPCGGDDGAGQRPEVHHSHEDKGLQKMMDEYFTITLCV